MKRIILPCCRRLAVIGVFFLTILILWHGYTFTGKSAQVFLENEGLGFPFINHANASVGQSFQIHPVDTIKSSNPDINVNKIEASGVLWNSDKSHFLLISDERYKKQAAIFIMDQAGLISARLAMLNDVSIDDLESISSDGEFIYVLSSLSHNKKGKLKKGRKKLIRFKYQDKEVTEQEEIDLYSVLNTLKDNPIDQELSLFLNQAINNHSLDIESHFVKDNNLYLGVKSPFTRRGKTLILKINNIMSLFSGLSSQASIWQSLNLLDPENGQPMLFSDMLEVKGQLYLLSVSRSSDKKSVLWHYQIEQQSIKAINQFPELNAEGLTYHPETKSLIIVFDEGKKTASKYLSIPLENVVWNDKTKKLIPITQQ